jgi:hypothetical protein
MSDWGDIPYAFGPSEARSEEADELFPIMGEKGITGKSSRPRAEAEEPVTERGADADLEPAAEKKNKRKNPSAKKLLKKMKKAAHEEHEHRHYMSLVDGDDERIHCDACGYSIGTVASTRKPHFVSKTHREAVVNYLLLKEEEAKEAKEGKRKFHQATLLEVEAMEKDVKRRREEKIIQDKQVTAHRKRVLKAFTERGIPVDVLDGDLLELLEEARPQRLSLGDKSNLSRDLMGELAKDELELEAREHKGEDVALNYDATPMNDDVAIVVSRICREDFTLEHRLVAVKRFARSLKSVHWQNVITTTLMDLSVPRPKFKVGLSDGCNVMVNVGTSLSQVYESFIFLLCHPHVWQKIPGKFHLQLLDNTLHCWRAVFKNSFAARAIFEEITGEKWNRGHKIRWNAKQDQAQQVARTFMSLQSINDELKAEKLCTETQPKLERILTGQLHLYSDFSLQLAARVDGGAHFVRITKLLEGDGFLAPFVVRYTLEVKKFIQEVMQAADPCLALPNVFALLRKAPDHVDTRKLWGVVKSWLKPGFDYVWKVMGGGQADEDGGHYSLDIYRVARLCHPSQATTLLEENKVIDFEKLLSGTDVRRHSLQQPFGRCG